MIVPMKKIRVLTLDSEKTSALQQLRRLGLVHIELSQTSGERLTQLSDQVGELQRAIFTVSELSKKKKVSPKELPPSQALSVARQANALAEEKKDLRGQHSVYVAELDRLKPWGEVDPAQLAELKEKGISLSLCQLSPAEYEKLDDTVRTISLGRTKSAVRFLAVEPEVQSEEDISPLADCRIPLPPMSTARLREQLSLEQKRIADIDSEISSLACYLDSMRSAIAALGKDIEFENCASSMARASVSEDTQKPLAVACLTGYIPAEDLDALKQTARENAWGLTAEDPTVEDNVPTKLHNNKFVSLIYPLTDFLGTVPGYFEYDISGWFLSFMLIFFGIIFGDGGYGLLIAGVAGALILREVIQKKPVSPLYMLIGLLGVATIIWGLLTCTWFGLTPDQVPEWLRNLSLPLISNVNADRIWYPFWTNGQVGLTTAQNLQILCFILALVQLSAAHIKGMIANRASLRLLGELGSLLQLWGMFYVVLAMVVNGEVFGLGLVINGIPIGTISIALVAVGFVLGFIFGSYEGSVKDSVLDSCKNIISIFLGVVNVFSDIISYIRLWAVGLAGAAISATVNEMAGPMLGSVTFIVFAVFLLVFGHGLNMILNVLSVIVHGVRLNTLEFSTHLGISWAGFKYDPFKE